MASKIAAAVVCGLVAGLLGRYVLIALLGAFGDIWADQDSLELLADVAPFAVGPFAAIICLIAPEGMGAWVRGCLFVTVLSGVVALTTLQCIGMGYLFGEIFDDPYARDAALAACPAEMTATLGLL
ncbi:MAG: hypothetical protein AAGJ28_11645, partial [Pseudomonadota bacterium]